MLILASVLIPLISWLWYVGGGKKAWARDWIIPALAGAYYALKYEPVLGLAVFGSCQIIRLGYGNYDPIDDPKASLLAKLLKDRNGWWIRALYGQICAIVATIPIMIYLIGFQNDLSILPWHFGFVFAFALGNFLVSRLRLNRLATDLIVGGIFSLIIFY